MKLIFENSRGEERVIAEPKDDQEAIEYIHAFVNECNAKRNDGRIFKIYYIRTYQHDGRKTFDVGSHIEFFHLID